MSVKRLGNKKYEIRGSVPTSTGKYHRYSLERLLIPSMMRVSLS